MPKIYLLPIFFFLILLSLGVAPPGTQAGTLYTEKQCLQTILSEKYCQEAFESSSGPVEIADIVSKANRDAALPGGDFTDPFWLSEEASSVAQGVGSEYNNPLVFFLVALLLLSFIFLLFDWKNILRTSHIDLLFLATAFLASFIIYSLGNLPLSVFLNAAILLFLMARMLFFSRGKGEGLLPSLPTEVFFFAILALLPLRFIFALFIGDVYDPGYSGVLGAKLLLMGEVIYGGFPPVVTAGDTYGPFNYYSYIPFQLLFPLQEVIPFYFESLAARWHALFFDLANVIMLFLIGREMQGRRSNFKNKGIKQSRELIQNIMQSRLGLVLVFSYLAFPLTAFALLGATNDALPVFLMLLAFLFFLKRKNIASGASLSLAMGAKFMPGLLAPLFSNSTGRRPSAIFILAFIITSLLILLPTIISPGLDVFWQETFHLQATRLSPNSLWGQTGIDPIPFTALSLLLALLGFRYPRRRQAALVAAFAAAILLAYQSSQMHWFYTYFIWAFPFIMIALLGADEQADEAAEPPQAQ